MQRSVQTRMWVNRSICKVDSFFQCVRAGLCVMNMQMSSQWAMTRAALLLTFSICFEYANHAAYTQRLCNTFKLLLTLFNVKHNERVLQFTFPKKFHIKSPNYRNSTKFALKVRHYVLYMLANFQFDISIRRAPNSLCIISPSYAN